MDVTDIQEEGHTPVHIEREDLTDHLDATENAIQLLDAEGLPTGDDTDNGTFLW